MPDYNLQRFADAQKNSYETALREIKGGRKKSHWMWFIFPQLQGLGSSPMSMKYAIRDLDEATAYLADPLLGPRLINLCDELLRLEQVTASRLMGYPDDLKLQSSMTLFAQAAGKDSVFMAVLKKYYGGAMDNKTLTLLNPHLLT